MPDDPNTGETTSVPPPWTEEARVLRIEEDDLLAVTLDDEPTDEMAEAIMQGIADWAGLPRDRIVILHGADLTVIRTGRDPDEPA